ncbi:MAG: hypothetical protein H7X89_09790 [Rhizobiales bacterium]|nr:hypothetical protein [Hyphomicrobiales bacterium]
MLEHPDHPADQHCKELLQRLIQSHGYLLQTGPEWCLYSKRNDYARPVDRVGRALVKILRDKGHLVPRPAGGLEPLKVKLEKSGRFTDHRPERPLEESRHPEINDAESPLAWLRSRKDKAGRPLISAEQFMAGERLRSDYERSCLERRVTAAWDLPATAGRSGGTGGAHLTDAALTARQNLNDALDEAGPELASILVQVCCLAAGIEQAERSLDLPQRSGKAVLGLALTALARHYGYIRPESRRRRNSGFGHWALGDYRPAIPVAEDS